jgi:23S rRNA pseudouridine1911/1915/1917 synthase
MPSCFGGPGRSRTKLSDKAECWIVPPNAVHIRLDQFLVSRIPGESRSQIQNWIRKGYLQVNGKNVKTGYLTKLDDRISLITPEPLSNQPFPEEIPLEILYEDSDLAVINKPAGLVCHAGAGVRSGTLVNALLHRMGPLDTGDPRRPGIVHRLDKFTSGVMLVAKNVSAHRQLALQFKNREVRKEYLALVYGKPSPSSGTIDIPIGRDPKNRKRMSTRAHIKRTAITHYTVKENLGPVSLLEIRIETGRTHQIRVHLAQKGHPIVGDALYGPNRTLNLPPDLVPETEQLQRPFLHSHRLEFHHPGSDERMAYTVPLPAELIQFLSLIKARRT